MSRLQSFIRWLFPVTTRTVDSRTLRRVVREAEWRWRDEEIGQQLRAAMHRRQDEDWESWSPKQRERARQNGEYYGEDRIE